MEKNATGFIGHRSQLQSQMKPIALANEAYFTKGHEKSILRYIAK